MTLKVKTIFLPTVNIVFNVFSNSFLVMNIPDNMVMITALPSKNHVVSTSKTGYSLFISSYDDTERSSLFRHELLFIDADDGVYMVRHNYMNGDFCVSMMYRYFG